MKIKPAAVGLGRQAHATLPQTSGVDMRVVSIGLAVVGGTAVLFVVFTALVKGFWAWTVPALFPGAVAQGLVARSLSWALAAKVALGLALLRGASEAGSTSTKSRRTE